MTLSEQLGQLAYTFWLHRTELDPAELKKSPTPEWVKLDEGERERWEGLALALTDYLAQIRVEHSNADDALESERERELQDYLAVQDERIREISEELKESKEEEEAIKRRFRMLKRGLRELNKI